MNREHPCNEQASKNQCEGRKDPEMLSIQHVQKELQWTCGVHNVLVWPGFHLYGLICLYVCMIDLNIFRCVCSVIIESVCRHVHMICISI
jgi:hypothetical protein